MDAKITDPELIKTIHAAEAISGLIPERAALPAIPCSEWVDALAEEWERTADFYQREYDKTRSDYMSAKCEAWSEAAEELRRACAESASTGALSNGGNAT